MLQGYVEREKCGRSTKSSDAWSEYYYMIKINANPCSRRMEDGKTKRECAPAENRTRGPTMATLDFTTKPLALAQPVLIKIYNCAVSFVHHRPHKTQNSNSKQLTTPNTEHRVKNHELR